MEEKEASKRTYHLISVKFDGLPSDLKKSKKIREFVQTDLYLKLIDKVKGEQSDEYLEGYLDYYFDELKEDFKIVTRLLLNPVREVYSMSSEESS